MSRIRANQITNQSADGAPTVQNGLIISGVTTVTTLDLNGDLDVDGHTNLDNVSVAGVTTFTGTIQVHESSSGSIDAIKVTNSTTGSNLTDGLSIGLQANENVFIHNYENTSMLFGTNDTERLRIHSAGQVQIAGDSIASISHFADDLIIGESGSSAINGITLCSTNSSGIRFHDTADMGEIEFDHGDNSLAIKANQILKFRTNSAERLRISSDGHVTKPNQPMCSFVVANTSAGNYMTHNAVLTNNGSHFNTSNNRFVCPVAGFYYASIMVMSNNSDTTMDLELHKNGSNASNILVPYSAATGGSYNQAVGSCIIECSANDYLQFKLNSGSVYQGRHSNISFCLLA